MAKEGPPVQARSPFPVPRRAIPKAAKRCLEGLLCLLLLSPGASTDVGSAESSSGYLHSEVIVPKQLESMTVPGSKTDMSYMIKVEGDYQVLRLQRRSFVVSNLPIYTYNMKGDVIADYPYIQDDCYYTGYVEGTPDSSVVLSTCAGLWGHVQIGTLKYEIEPIENSTTFQHLIYRKNPEQREPCRGVVKDGAAWTDEDGGFPMVDLEDLAPPSWGADDPERSTVTSYLEYYAVVDKGTFVAQERNETRLMLTVLLMMLNVHAIYLPLDLHVYLVGLELWTERDYSTTGTNNLGVTLQAFYKYARDHLRHRAHFDHAGIIVAEGYPSGLAWGDRFCHYTHVSVSAVRVGVSKS